MTAMKTRTARSCDRKTKVHKMAVGSEAAMASSAPRALSPRDPSRIRRDVACRAEQVIKRKRQQRGWAWLGGLRPSRWPCHSGSGPWGSRGRGEVATLDPWGVTRVHQNFIPE